MLSESRLLLFIRFGEVYTAATPANVTQDSGSFLFWNWNASKPSKVYGRLNNFFNYMLPIIT